MPQRHGRRAMQQHAARAAAGHWQGRWHTALARRAGRAAAGWPSSWAAMAAGMARAWSTGGNGRATHGPRALHGMCDWMLLDAFSGPSSGGARVATGQGAGSAGVARQNGSRIVRTAGGARLGMTKDDVKPQHAPNATNRSFLRFTFLDPTPKSLNKMPRQLFFLTIIVFFAMETISSSRSGLP